MYIFDGFVYGGEPKAPIRIKEVRPMPDRIMILAFENGEYRCKLGIGNGSVAAAVELRMEKGELKISVPILTDLF